MAMPDRVHSERHRAESFGAVAEAYDRFRPSYPDALIDDLVAAQPAEALDIGCGTGKASRLIAGRGAHVLGVEIDEDMAEVARRSGLDVEVASFEQWDPRGRTFDLVISGQAWHWIDPAVGVAKVAGLLRPGALLGLFWNTVSLAEPMRAALRAVYERLAPGVLVEGRQFDETGEPPYADDLRGSGLFSAVETRRYPWDVVYTAQAWTQMVQTHSDHVVMPAEQRAAVIDAVTAAIEERGGSVPTHYVTQAIIATASH